MIAAPWLVTNVTGAGFTLRRVYRRRRARGIPLNPIEHYLATLLSRRSPTCQKASFDVNYGLGVSLPTIGMLGYATAGRLIAPVMQETET